MPKLIPPRPLYRREQRIVGLAVPIPFLVLLLYRVFSHRLPFSHNTLTLLILEVAALLLPASLIMWIRGKGYAKAIRLKRPHVSHLPLLLAAFFALLFGSFILSALCGGLGSLGNPFSRFSLESSDTVSKKALCAITGALLPAILEELFFRGVITAEYERRGTWRAILMSTLLFALLHLDVRNFLAYLFAGTLLILTLYATDSLVAVMLLHGAWAVCSFFLQDYLSALYRYTGNPALLVFLLITLTLISLILLTRFGARIYRRRDEYGIGNPRRDVPASVQLYTIIDGFCDFGVILAIVLAVVGFVLFY